MAQVAQGAQGSKGSEGSEGSEGSRMYRLTPVYHCQMNSVKWKAYLTDKLISHRSYHNEVAGITQRFLHYGRNDESTEKRYCYMKNASMKSGANGLSK